MQNIEDAARYLIMILRDAGGGSYGYELYVPTAVRGYVRSRGMDSESGPGHKLMIQLSGLFFDAAWELARRGIVRPGVKTTFLQATDEGSAGAGFCVTPFGRKWLAEDTQDIWVSTEPDRFAEMIRRFVQNSERASTRVPKRRFVAMARMRIWRAVRWWGPPRNPFFCRPRSLKPAMKRRLLQLTLVRKVGAGWRIWLSANCLIR